MHYYMACLSISYKDWGCPGVLVQGGIPIISYPYMQFVNVSFLCVPVHKDTTQRLQYVQNMAARVVCQMSKFQYITPVLQELHWLPIQYHIIFKILLLVYKSLNGALPSYLAKKLHYHSPYRSSRSVSNELAT